MLINTFLVGAMKAGTTYIADVLAQHPEICFARPKETMYFIEQPEDLSTRRLGPAVLERALSHYRGERRVCEGSTLNLSATESPRLIYEHNPDALLLCVLRDPVSRAMSHYRHLARAGRVRVGPDEFFASPTPALAAVMSASNYPVHIRRYQEQFGAVALRTYLYEDIGRDAEAFFLPLLTDLGVTPSLDGMDLDIRSNETRVPTSAGLQKLLFRNRRLLRAAKALVPNTLYEGARKTWSLLEQLNVRPMTESDRNSALISELRPRFAEVVSGTEALLCREISAWRQ